MKRQKTSEKTCYPVITIGRQFGSGGRRIGRLVAELMGFSYYDTELLSEAAARLGYAKEIFHAHDERKPTPLRSLLQGMYGLADNFHDVSICGERMYKEQAQVIRDICSRGPCVIVGRTADHILKGHPLLLSVFLHAPATYRAGRLVKFKDAETETVAKEMLKKQDRDRENYYNYYTGSKNWGKAFNYHLSIDSSLFNDEKVAEMITSAASEIMRSHRQ